jgi:hypothetical protein
MPNSSLCDPHAVDTQPLILVEIILFLLHLLTFSDPYPVHRLSHPLIIVGKFARAFGTNGEIISQAKVK